MHTSLSNIFWGCYPPHPTHARRAKKKEEATRDKVNRASGGIEGYIYSGGVAIRSSAIRGEGCSVVVEGGGETREVEHSVGELRL